jgi:hypothetical protein
MQGLEDGEAEERTVDVGAIGAIREGSSQSKILTHFIKGKISLFPMETILSILSELEYLESLIKFGRKNRDENLKDTNLVKPNETALELCTGLTIKYEEIEKLEKEFNKTTISNHIQMLEDDEFEDQSSVEESQDTSEDEENLLGNAPQDQ